jgi:hypothetical protein
MLDVEIITPERAAEMLEKVDGRYREMGFFEGHSSQFLLEEVRRGWRPCVVVNVSTGEVFDGAFALRAIQEHGEPVECAVARLPADPRRGQPLVRDAFGKLPKEWQHENMRPRGNEER